MLRRMVLVLAGLTALLALLVTTALATPSSPELVVVTARGELAEPLKVNTEFDNGGKVKIKTQGPVELITQRVEAPPGSTFGWHTHPGETFVIIAEGTLTLYHAGEHDDDDDDGDDDDNDNDDGDNDNDQCAHGIEYVKGSAFGTHPDDVHLAKNNGTETVVLFATYFAPKTTPPTPVRLDALLPAPGCPQ